MREGLEELARFLGGQCIELPLPADFPAAHEARVTVNLAEMAWCYRSFELRGGDALPPAVRAAIERGKAITAPDYLAALALRPRLLAPVDEILGRVDAILCPAAPGPAPEGYATTGNPIFNGLWTLIGVPRRLAAAPAVGRRSADRRPARRTQGRRRPPAPHRILAHGPRHRRGRR